MNRLPRYDRTTRRSEVVVFLSLGLAGVMMVSMTAAQMTRFVAGSDRIAASLAARQTPPSGGARADNDHRMLTNVDASVAAWNGGTDHGTRGLAATVPQPLWR